MANLNKNPMLEYRCLETGEVLSVNIKEIVAYVDRPYNMETGVKRHVKVYMKSGLIFLLDVLYNDFDRKYSLWYNC